MWFQNERSGPNEKVSKGRRTCKGDTDSRILYLDTGEIYWLGAHEITRIR